MLDRIEKLGIFLMILCTQVMLFAGMMVCAEQGDPDIVLWTFGTLMACVVVLAVQFFRE
jgi:hypothetical protein